MKVYVLLRVDSYDRSDVLGVYSTEERAKAVAQADDEARAQPSPTLRRNRRPLTWESFDGHHISRYGIYDYAIEAHEVDPAR